VDYAGKVLHVFPEREIALSERLWTEGRFPWVFLLRGRMVHVPWPCFLDRIGYASSFDPRGRVYGISKAKMRAKGYGTDHELIEAILG
jgi:hypothetical protein